MLIDGERVARLLRLARPMRFLRGSVLGPALTSLLVACNDPPASTATANAPNVVTSNVIWPASTQIDRALLGALGAEARAKVSRAPVPVLVPRGDDLVAASLVVEPEFYAFSHRRDGLTVAVQATRREHRHEGVGPIRGDRPLRGTMGFVTENEGIRSASWRENGVAYSVDLECETPTDARCADDTLVTSIVEGLSFVGGGGR